MPVLIYDLDVLGGTSGVLCTCECCGCCAGAYLELWGIDYNSIPYMRKIILTNVSV